MKLRNVIPNMAETFGVLTFAGEGEVVTEGNGARRKTVQRIYRLYSEKQKADNIEVVLPASAGEKRFEYEEAVMLVNPYIEAQGKSIGRNQAYTDYVLYADDLKKAQ